MVCIEHLKEAAPAYLELGKSMLFSVQDSFLALAEDPQEYWDDFQHGLPVWLQNTSPKPSTLSPGLQGIG